MPTCPQCQGQGFKMSLEDGSMVKDSCYKCGETGQVSAEQMRAYLLDGLVDEVAWRMTYEAEQACKSHPEGEDWAFAAAENMCSLEEYRHGRFVDIRVGVAEKIMGLEKADPSMVTALINMVPS